MVDVLRGRGSARWQSWIFCFGQLLRFIEPPHLHRLVQFLLRCPDHFQLELKAWKDRKWLRGECASFCLLHLWGRFFWTWVARYNTNRCLDFRSGEACERWHFAPPQTHSSLPCLHLFRHREVAVWIRSIGPPSLAIWWLSNHWSHSLLFLGPPIFYFGTSCTASELGNGSLRGLGSRASQEAWSKALPKVSCSFCHCYWLGCSSECCCMTPKFG